MFLRKRGGEGGLLFVYYCCCCCWSWYCCCCARFSLWEERVAICIKCGPSLFLSSGKCLKKCCWRARSAFSLLATIQNPEKSRCWKTKKLLHIAYFYFLIYYLPQIQARFALVMCRVPPKIATLEVQNRETATCRDLLLMMISNHACCWCYSPAGGGRLLVLSWWWVTWSCCSLYNKLTLSRQFELFPMRHAVRLPLSLHVPIGTCTSRYICCGWRIHYHYWDATIMLPLITLK